MACGARSVRGNDDIRLEGVAGGGVGRAESGVTVGHLRRQKKKVKINKSQRPHSG